MEVLIALQGVASRKFRILNDGPALSAPTPVAQGVGEETQRAFAIRQNTVCARGNENTCKEVCARGKFVMMINVITITDIVIITSIAMMITIMLIIVRD